MGVATLPPSFLPSETQAFYFINRPPTPNIIGGSVSTHNSFIVLHVKSPSRGNYCLLVLPTKIGHHKIILRNNNVNLLGKSKIKKSYGLGFTTNSD